MSYKGLTIIIDKPSRFDYDSGKLISGRAGDWFTACLTPFNRFNCDIRILANPAPLKEDTKVVFTLGPESLNKFKPGSPHKLTTHRGSPFIKDNQLYIPSFTPQDTFDRKDYENPQTDNQEKGADKESEKDYQRTQRKNWKFWLYQDIKKAIRITQFGPRLYPKINYRIAPSASEVISVLSGAFNWNLVLDIETDEAHNLNCFAFLVTPHNQIKLQEELTVYVVPFKRYDNTIAYDKPSFARILLALSEAFKHNQVITHNGSFDLFVLAYRYYIPFPRANFDTMVGHHRLFPEVEKSLGHAVSCHTDLPFHKDEGVFNPKTASDEQKLWLYNGKDVSTTYFVYLGLIPALKAAGAWDSALQGCASMRPYLTMMHQGMKVDTKMLTHLADEFDLKFEQMNRVLSHLTGIKNLNARSHQQVGKYLYETLKLPVPAQDPTKESTLLKLYARYNVPSIRVILAAREAGKLKSSLAFKLWRGDRLTTHLKITGTNTFRGASSALLKFRKYTGFGTNTQNFSKKVRRIVIADPGFKLGQTDQAGAEALVVAYLSSEGKFRSLFKFGIKPHAYVAMQIAASYWADKLGLSNLDDYLNSPIHLLKTLKYWPDLAKLIAESDNHPEPRYQFYKIGKTMCHSLNYDAEPAMFQLTALMRSEGALRLTMDEATKYHSLYRYDLFPEITGYHCAVQRDLENNNRVLRNLFGYPRKFSGLWGRELFKEGYAFIPQSTVGCITHIAFTRLQALIDNSSSGDLMHDVSLLQNGHDSILWQAPSDLALEVGRVVKKEMEMNLVNFSGEQFRMGSGTSIGKNWGNEDYKNPSGLVELKGEWYK